MSLGPTPAMQKFILHWGEMGTKWGINRTVAQIHALLYLADTPMHADEIVETLSVARSNVSTSLKELQAWGIVRVVHVLGDRRDHFESLTDVWEMFRMILDERKRREVDPTIRILRECLDELERERKTKRQGLSHKRLSAMLEFFETMSTWYRRIRELPQSVVIKLAKIGGKGARTSAR